MTLLCSRSRLYCTAAATGLLHAEALSPAAAVESHTVQKAEGEGDFDEHESRRSPRVSDELSAEECGRRERDNESEKAKENAKGRVRCEGLVRGFGAPRSWSTFVRRTMRNEILDHP